MKKYLILLVFGVLSLGLFACGNEEEWDTEVGAEISEELTETALSSVESELAIADRLKWECFCDLSANTCDGDYPFSVVKKTSCRYKRATGTCSGRCVGRCANGVGRIKKKSEFKGRCMRRLIRPDGAIFEEVVDCDRDGVGQDEVDR